MKHFNSVGLKTKKPTNKFISWLFAEAGGFEPPVPLRVRQFSKLVVSATHPHFHVFCASSLELRCKDRCMFLNKQSFLHLFSKKKMLLLLPILILRILFDKK